MAYLNGKKILGDQRKINPKLQAKNATPTTSAQEITADQNYDGLSKVTISAIQLQQKSATPTTSQQQITPDANKDGLSKVTISAVTSAIDSNIKAQNIKKNVTILGVTGNYGGTMQAKSATPTTSQQTITPSSGYDGLSSVTISAVTAAIDANIQAGNIKKNVTILGVTGTCAGDLTTKTITQNGTYNASDDSADGYSQVVVDVQGGGGSGDLDGLIDGSISGVVTSNATKVMQYKFYNCYKVTEVNLPNATEIEQYAFSGTYTPALQNAPKLKKVNCPNVITIGARAFYYALSNSSNIAVLEEANFPEALTIGDYAFYGCKLLTDKINFEKVTSIGQYAFYWNYTLTGTFVCKAATIGQYAFTNVRLTALDCYATSLGSSINYQSSTLRTFYLRADSVCAITSSTFYSLSASRKITVYVPSDLIESYKTATNWSSIYNNGYVDFVALPE